MNLLIAYLVIGLYCYWQMWKEYRIFKTFHLIFLTFGWLPVLLCVCFGAMGKAFLRDDEMKAEKIQDMIKGGLM